MVPTQLTRRRAIAAGGVTCASGLAGCLDGVLGSANGGASYADWLGTTMAGREWPTDGTTDSGVDRTRPPRHSAWIPRR